MLYNLGINHVNVNNDPAVADGTAARAFQASDTNRYDLTDERPIAAANRGLQAFIQLETSQQNPISNDGLTAWNATGTNPAALTAEETNSFIVHADLAPEIRQQIAVLFAHLREIKGASGVAGIDQALNQGGAANLD